jgi:hypothetical protein
MLMDQVLESATLQAEFSRWITALETELLSCRNTHHICVPIDVHMQRLKDAPIERSGEQHALRTAAAVYVFDRHLLPLLGRYEPQARIAFHQILLGIFVRPPTIRKSATQFASMLTSASFAQRPIATFHLEPRFVDKVNSVRRAFVQQRSANENIRLRIEHRETVMAGVMVRLQREGVRRVLIAWKVYTARCKRLRFRFTHVFASLTTTNSVKTAISLWQTLARKLKQKPKRSFVVAPQDRQMQQQQTRTTLVQIVRVLSHQRHIKTSMLESGRVTEKTMEAKARASQDELDRQKQHNRGLARRFVELMESILPITDENDSGETSHSGSVSSSQLLEKLSAGMKGNAFRQTTASATTDGTATDCLAMLNSSVSVSAPFPLFEPAFATMLTSEANMQYVAWFVNYGVKGHHLHTFECPAIALVAEHSPDNSDDTSPSADANILKPAAILRRRWKDKASQLKVQNIARVEGQCEAFVSRAVSFSIRGGTLAAEVQRLHEDLVSSQQTSSRDLNSEFLAGKLRSVFGRDTTFWRPVLTARKVIRTPEDFEDMLAVIAALGQTTLHALRAELSRCFDDSDMFFQSLHSAAFQLTIEGLQKKMQSMFDLLVVDSRDGHLTADSWLKFCSPLVDHVFTFQHAEDIHRYAVSHIDGNHDDNSLHAFCIAIAMLAQFKVPNPFMSLQRKVSTFVETFGEMLHSSTKRTARGTA